MTPGVDTAAVSATVVVVSLEFVGSVAGMSTADGTETSVEPSRSTHAAETSSGAPLSRTTRPVTRAGADGSLSEATGVNVSTVAADPLAVTALVAGARRGWATGRAICGGPGRTERRSAPAGPAPRTPTPAAAAAGARPLCLRGRPESPP